MPVLPEFEIQKLTEALKSFSPDAQLSLGLQQHIEKFMPDQLNNFRAVIKLSTENTQASQEITNYVEQSFKKILAIQELINELKQKIHKTLPEENLMRYSEKPGL